MQIGFVKFRNYGITAVPLIEPKNVQEPPIKTSNIAIRVWTAESQRFDG